MNRRQLKLIRILQFRVNNATSLQSLAAMMGYRPSTSGILPVLSTLNAINRKHADLLVRLGPKDEWGVECWGFNDMAGVHPELFECKSCHQQFDRNKIDLYIDLCEDCWS